MDEFHGGFPKLYLNAAQVTLHALHQAIRKYSCFSVAQGIRFVENIVVIKS